MDQYLLDLTPLYKTKLLLKAPSAYSSTFAKCVWFKFHLLCMSCDTGMGYEWDNWVLPCHSHSGHDMAQCQVSTLWKGHKQMPGSSFFTAEMASGNVLWYWAKTETGERPDCSVCFVNPARENSGRRRPVDWVLQYVSIGFLLLEAGSITF